MATLFKTDFTTEDFELPTNPSLEFLQEKVGGMIEFFTFADGSAFMVNEEGKLLGMPYNGKASVLTLLKGRPEELSGPCVFFSADEMKRMDPDEEDDETEKVLES